MLLGTLVDDLDQGSATLSVKEPDRAEGQIGCEGGLVSVQLLESTLAAESTRN